jgi:hypothetical protein
MNWNSDECETTDEVQAILICGHASLSTPLLSKVNTFTSIRDSRRSFKRAAGDSDRLAIHDTWAQGHVTLN